MKRNPKGLATQQRSTCTELCWLFLNDTYKIPEFRPIVNQTKVLSRQKYIACLGLGLNKLPTSYHSKRPGGSVSGVEGNLLVTKVEPLHSTTFRSK